MPTPLTNQPARFVGHRHAEAGGPLAQHHFDHRLGELLRRHRFPTVALEPGSVGGEALGGQESPAQLDVLGAGVLEVVAELVDEGGLQVGSGGGDAQRHRPPPGVVTGPVGELPGARQGDSAQAAPTGGEGLGEGDPGPVGQLPHVLGHPWCRLELRAGVPPTGGRQHQPGQRRRHPVRHARQAIGRWGGC
ncbi:MAG: hypothetical protein ACRDVM_00950 [Acidimicrobiia bacterium]